MDAEEKLQDDQETKQLDQPNGLPNDPDGATIDAHSTEPNDDHHLRGDSVEAQLIPTTSDIDPETTIVAQNDLPTSDLTNGTSVEEPLQLWAEDQNAEEQELVPDVRFIHEQQRQPKRINRSHKYVFDRRSTAIPLLEATRGSRSFQYGCLTLALVLTCRLARA